MRDDSHWSKTLSPSHSNLYSYLRITFLLSHASRKESMAKPQEDIQKIRFIFIFNHQEGFSEQIIAAYYELSMWFLAKRP